MYLCFSQIGLYFAWLGFYNQLLIMPAVFGFLVFLYGALTVMNWDINYAGLVMDKSSLFYLFCFSGEVCNKTSEIAKRPICPEFPEYGPIRPMHESCHLYNVAYLFDNDLTVIFALFMSLWATVFMELWKRRQSVMVWEWDLEMDEQEEQTRPEFEVLKSVLLYS